MEVVQEDHCSQGLVRLTCRSLKAFIFVLEAEYLSNLTNICGYESHKSTTKKAYKNVDSDWLFQRKELRGNYVHDAEELRHGMVDIRQSLNRRYAVQYFFTWRIEVTRNRSRYCGGSCFSKLRGFRDETLLSLFVAFRHETTASGNTSTRQASARRVESKEYSITGA